MYRLLFLFLTLTLLSCQTAEKKQQAIENISYEPKGKLNNGQADSTNYYNDYFGFSLPIKHENWTIFSEAQYQDRIKSNKEELALNEKEFEKTKSNIHNLLTLEKYYNTPQGQEQYISFMAEGLDSLKKASNAIEYIYWTDSFLKKRHSTSYPKYTTLSIDTGHIGNRNFIIHSLLIEDDAQTKRYQKTYCAQYGKYLLNILVCYYTDEQLKNNLELLNKITWN